MSVPAVPEAPAPPSGPSPSPSSTTTCLTNGQFFRPTDRGPASSDPNFSDCLIIDDATGTIKYVGYKKDAEAQKLLADCTTTRDLGGKVVTPGLIDAHMHLLYAGESLNKLDLTGQTTLEGVQTAIREYAAANPDLPRVLIKGWMPFMTNDLALATDLDGLDSQDPPRPIYVSAADMHSAWLSTTALVEAGIPDMPDPEGGSIVRDADGNATGLLLETAALGYLWPFLSRISSIDERLKNSRDAFNDYMRAGYTGVIELATDPTTWETLVTYREREPSGMLPIDMAAHIVVLPSNATAEMADVERAIELHKTWNAQSTPDLRITGIKVLLDGVVDSCTAAMQSPYSHNSSLIGDLSWTSERIMPLLRRADEAGLQIAMHAIGDNAIKFALDSLEQVGNVTGRHRIEHLETCTPEDAKRLGPLGITASVQPVHLDPAYLDRWELFLGPERNSHVFPYSEMAMAGAQLALGTDAPTAPVQPRNNLYIATTRRSYVDPTNSTLKSTTPQFALGLAAALSGMTYGGAYSCFDEHRVGSLEAGMMANLAVLDMNWDPASLLTTNVTETWSRGRRIWAAEDNSQPPKNGAKCSSRRARRH